MTNESASRANGEDMSRADMQIEALVVEALLEAAMATRDSANPDDSFVLMEMAHSRATQLNRALDSVNSKGLT